MSTKNDGQAAKSIGVIGAVIIGGVVYHWLNKGSISTAMTSAPTDWWSLISTAGTAGFASLFLGKIPVVGPWITKALESITALSGVGKKVRDQIPPQLMTDIMALVSGGPPTLSEIQKVLSSFSTIDTGLIFDLIKDAFNKIHPSPSPVNPPGPVGPVTSMKAPTGDVPVVVA